jgi:hypothetical protein
MSWRDRMSIPGASLLSRSISCTRKTAQSASGAPIVNRRRRTGLREWRQAVSERKAVAQCARSTDWYAERYRSYLAA